MYWIGIIISVISLILIYLLFRYMKKNPDKMNNPDAWLEFGKTGFQILEEVGKQLDKNKEDDKKHIVEKFGLYGKKATAFVRQTYGTVKEYAISHPEMELKDIKDELKSKAIEAMKTLAEADGFEWDQINETVITILMEAGVFGLGFLGGSESEDTPELPETPSE